jgi:hypothetical protein
MGALRKHFSRRLRARHLGRPGTMRGMLRTPQEDFQLSVAPMMDWTDSVS